MFGRTTKSMQRIELQWFIYSKHISGSSYPRTQKRGCMLHLDQLANKLPNSLNNTTSVIKSRILGANVHAIQRDMLSKPNLWEVMVKVLQSYKQRTMRRCVLHVRLCFQSLSKMTLKNKQWLIQREIAINFVKTWKIFNPQMMYPCKGMCNTQMCASKHWDEWLKKKSICWSTKIAINFVKTWKLWDHTHINLNDTFCFMYHNTRTMIVIRLSLPMLVIKWMAHVRSPWDLN